jgi:hypothetical protein
MKSRSWIVPLSLCLIALSLQACSAGSPSPSASKTTPLPISIFIHGNNALLTEAYFSHSYNPGLGKLTIPNGKKVLVVRGKVVSGSLADQIQSVAAVDENNKKTSGMFTNTDENIEWAFIVDEGSKDFTVIINDSQTIDLKPLLG